MQSPGPNPVVMALKDHGCVGLAAAAFKESMRREAMIGMMIPFALAGLPSIN